MGFYLVFNGLNNMLNVVNHLREIRILNQVCAQTIYNTCNGHAIKD